MLANGSLKKLKIREIPFYLIYGVVAGGCTFACYMTAIEHLSIAMAAILLYTSPAFVILINRVVYKEPITRVKLLAVLCTFGGCLLVLQAYHVEILAHNLPWVGVGLAAGVCFSMTTVGGETAVVSRCDFFSPVAVLWRIGRFRNRVGLHGLPERSGHCCGRWKRQHYRYAGTHRGLRIRRHLLWGQAGGAADFRNPSGGDRSQPPDSV